MRLGQTRFAIAAGRVLIRVQVLQRDGVGRRPSQRGFELNARAVRGFGLFVQLAFERLPRRIPGAALFDVLALGSMQLAAGGFER